MIKGPRVTWIIKADGKTVLKKTVPLLTPDQLRNEDNPKPPAKGKKSKREGKDAA